MLGFLENVAAGVTKAGLKDIFAFILLILTLLFRPQGLLGVRKTAVETDGAVITSYSIHYTKLYDYSGTNGGFVLISADDPGMHSSQNEQDNRYLARMGKVPLLEPSDAQECKDFIVFGLEP